MLGWSMRARAWRSASKRATTWRVSIPGLSTFSATLRRTGSVCSAMNTTPNPPSPICSSSLYGPTTEPVPSPAGWSMVATGSRATGRSPRNPPASSWARSRASIRRRSWTSEPHAVSRNAARSPSDGRSIAPAKMDSISGLASSIELPRPCGPQKTVPRFGAERASAVRIFWKWDDVSLRPQGVVEPGAGEGPVPVGGAPGDPHRVGGLVQGQAGEEAQLDQLGTGRVPSGQLLQGVVDGEELLVRCLVGYEKAVEIDALPTAAPLLPALVPRAVDEDAPHGLSGRGEEVAAAGPVLGLIHIHQPDVGFVDQGGGLERLAGL